MLQIPIYFYWLKAVGKMKMIKLIRKLNYFTYFKTYKGGRRIFNLYDTGGQKI